MTENDRAEFVEIMQAIYSLYNKDFSKPLLKLWWASLAQYDMTDVRQALSGHVQNPDNGQFLPRPADVVRHLTGTTQTKSLEAWAKVERAIRSVGAYQSVTFDDPAIMAALQDMGGWVAICRTSDQEMPFKAQEFGKRHAGYVNKPLAHYPKKFAGLIEAENGRGGFQKFIPDPVFIGDESAAKQVYLDGSDKPKQLFNRNPFQDVVLKLNGQQGNETETEAA